MVQARKFVKQVNRYGKKKQKNPPKKYHFLNLKKKTKLGSSTEIELPAKTTHDLKHSVSLPTELSSETKTKSEFTSGATRFMPDMGHKQSHLEGVDMYVQQ